MLHLKAQLLVTQLMDISKELKIKWDAPLVNINDNDVCLEWWSSKKNLKLTIYVEKNNNYFLKVYDDGDIVCGEIKAQEDLIDLWQWLKN